MMLRQPTLQKGYAIVVVMILMIVGAGIILFANTENLFFTKLSSFFNRSKQIQTVAENGIKLAELDLEGLTRNSMFQDPGTVDTFTQLVGEPSQLPIDHGLHVFNVDVDDRDITPRITRQEGDVTLQVTYFPIDPCVPDDCEDEGDYNRKNPKYFDVVSRAFHQKTGDVYTVESRLKVRFENFTEIAYGILGVGAYPYNPDNGLPSNPNNSKWRFIPSEYGRTHFNIPGNLVKFIFKGGLNVTTSSYHGPGRTHTFTKVATFEGEEEDVSEGRPFTLRSVTYNGVNGDTVMKPIMDFKAGYQTGVDLVVEPGDEGYDPTRDPANDAYYAQLEAMADGGEGVNLTASASSGCAVNTVTGRTETRVCLKMQGDTVYEYNCNANSQNFMQPRIDVVVDADDFKYATGGWSDALDDSSFPDRYVGERADVRSGTTTGATTSYDANGVFYCKSPNPGCECNIHVKGVYEGKLTMVADNIVIEGDIVNKDQNPLDSQNVFGAIAQRNIIIPEGLPQAATSNLSNFTMDYSNNTDKLKMTSGDPPIQNCTTPGASCPTPASLAESYLNITNFLGDDGSNYVDRDFNNVDYKDHTTWIDHNDPNPSVEYYNSPMALDLDGHFYAAEHVEVTSIFNPELTTEDDKGMVMLTCDNPSVLGGCTGPNAEYSYREPFVDGDPATDNPLYTQDTDGDYIMVTDDDTGEEVEGVFWIDGLGDAQNAVTISSSTFDDDVRGNTNTKVYEDVPRVKNAMLHVFGSMNSKYYFSEGRFNSFDVGFQRRLIKDDPRAGFLVPPGFPSTSNVVIEELYRKSYHGDSSRLDEDSE